MIARPIRVLHLRDSPWIDGPGRTIVETAGFMDPARVTYHVGAFVTEGKAHPLVESLRSRGASVHSIADRRGVGAELVDSVVRLIDALKIDVLHTSDVRSNLLGLRVRRKRPVKLVCTAHGWITNSARSHVFVFLDRVLLRLFDRVMLVSHGMRRRVPRWWVPDARVRIVHNALNLASYGTTTPIEHRRVPDTAGDPAAKVRILNVGRLSPEKGQELLLKAIARLAPRFAGLRLDFAGVGPLESRLRQAAAELGIADRVGFLGFVQDMPAVYRNTDLVVQSSFTEGLPNVMLEVAWLEVPVVATDVGGTAEVIEHARTGWLVRPRSLDALCAGLERYLSSPAEFGALARNGRDKIAREFSIDARAEKQMRFYEELT